jgi:hypothetical protein
MECASPDSCSQQVFFKVFLCTTFLMSGQGSQKHVVKSNKKNSTPKNLHNNFYQMRERKRKRGELLYGCQNKIYLMKDNQGQS